MSQSTLTRALMVIDEISRQPDGMRFSEVQKLLGNPSPTTVNKILKELISGGALSKADDGRYVMGLKTYFWGKAAAAGQGPMLLIRQCMADLHRKFEASVNLFTCSHEHMLCLESITSPQSPSLWPAGTSLPLQLSIIGSIFFFPQESLADETFVQTECIKHSSELSIKKVMEMIDKAHKTGIQFDAGLFYPGVYRLAVPIMKNGHNAMVLGLGTLEARISNEIIEQISSAMLEIKQQIELDMNI